MIITKISFGKLTLKYFNWTICICILPTCNTAVKLTKIVGVLALESIDTEIKHLDN